MTASGDPPAHAGLRAPAILVDRDVTLHPWNASGMPLLVAGAQDPEVTRWTQLPTGLTMFEAGWITAGWALSDSRCARWTIGLDGDRHAGMAVAWTDREVPDVAELGYWLLALARGRGVGTRAVRLVCGWLFDDCGMSALRITTIPGNLASEALARRLGFHPDGSVERDVKGSVRELHRWLLQPGQARRRQARA